MPLLPPTTPRQTTTPTTSWSVVTHCYHLNRLFLQSVSFLCSCDQSVFSLVLQNEPTFYTTDGTPFTAADPGAYHNVIFFFFFFVFVFFFSTSKLLALGLIGSHLEMVTVRNTDDNDINCRENAPDVPPKQGTWGHFCSL